MLSANNPKLKTQKAFTLIELLVVIAIVGILAGMAVVSMSGATESARIAKLKVYSNSIRSSLMGNRVSEWKFDEGTGTTTADTVGTNNGDLTGHAPAWKTGTDCISGSCLQFNGTSNYVDAGHDASLKITSAITIEAWVKGTVDNQYHGIVAKDSWTGGGRSYAMAISDANKLRMFVGTDGTGVVDSTNNVPNNVWTHVVGTFNGTTLKVYINAILDNTANSVPMVTNNLSVLVGALNPSSPQLFFNGTIDEVHIYNEALTASAIREQYLAGLDKFLADNQITKQDYRQRSAELNLTYAVSGQ
jgi:prepilin-type N-terminal cleavage/methylation domain-containing protein